MFIFLGHENCTKNDFVDSFLGAQLEAAASFGINTILLEKYITQPRHIEVQVLLGLVMPS